MLIFTPGLEGDVVLVTGTPGSGLHIKFVKSVHHHWDLKVALKHWTQTDGTFLKYTLYTLMKTTNLLICLLYFSGFEQSQFLITMRLNPDGLFQTFCWRRIRIRWRHCIKMIRPVFWCVRFTENFQAMFVWWLCQSFRMFKFLEKVFGQRWFIHTLLKLYDFIKKITFQICEKM